MIEKWSRDFQNLDEVRETDSIDEFHGVPARHSKRRAVHQKMHSVTIFLFGIHMMGVYESQNEVGPTNILICEKCSFWRFFYIQSVALIF